MRNLALAAACAGALQGRGETTRLAAGGPSRAGPQAVVTGCITVPVELRPDDPNRNRFPLPTPEDVQRSVQRLAVPTPDDLARSRVRTVADSPGCLAVPVELRPDDPNRNRFPLLTPGDVQRSVQRFAVLTPDDLARSRVRTAADTPARLEIPGEWTRTVGGDR